MAPLEWPHFCELWCGDRNFGPGDELWHAGYRRLQSGGGDDTVCHVFSFRAVQGVLAYPAAGNRAAPRVVDSRLLGWACRGHHPPPSCEFLLYYPLSILA